MTPPSPNSTIFPYTTLFRAPGVDRIPDEESGAGDCKAHEQQGEDDLEPHAADCFVGKGECVVVDEMGEDPCAHSMSEEQVAEPQASDHAGDDLPISPARGMGESETRRAR